MSVPHGLIEHIGCRLPGASQPVPVLDATSLTNGQVWQSVRDWDPHSRGMLAGYLQAANTMVRSKQARPGVAIHVRLGGKNGDGGGGGGKNGGGGASTSNGNNNSYAVWALTTGVSSAAGDVRVACSEIAQTEIPASAIQRVQVRG